MTLPDLLSILTTVAVGAGATLITLRVTMAKVEAQLEASNVRIGEAEKRNLEAMNAFRVEASELRKAVSELTRIVDKQSSYVDGVEDLWELVRTIEKDMAVCKSKIGMA
jgi:hypothetical protein